MFSVKGVVQKGESRGSSIGFPTININAGSLDAKNGVYAVRLGVGKNVYGGVANLGTAPTFNRNRRLLEVHIFGFSGSIYGEEVEVSFVKFLRDEKKFASVEDLKEQIRKDVEKAKEILGKL